MIPLKIRALAIAAVISFWTAISLASNNGQESLQEHATAVMDFQWWIIGGLFTLSSGCLVFIYMSGRRSDNRKFDVLFQELKYLNEKFDTKLNDVITRPQHDEIDHSRLCPRCRQ